MDTALTRASAGRILARADGLPTYTTERIGKRGYRHIQTGAFVIWDRLRPDVNFFVSKGLVCAAETPHDGRHVNATFSFSPSAGPEHTDDGDDLLVRVSDLVFGEVTGIRQGGPPGTAVVEYTVQRRNWTAFGRYYAESEPDRFPAVEARQARLVKYDDGWRSEKAAASTPRLNSTGRPSGSRSTANRGDGFGSCPSESTAQPSGGTPTAVQPDAVGRGAPDAGKDTAKTLGKVNWNRTSFSLYYQVQRRATRLRQSPLPLYPQTLKRASVTGHVLVAYVVDSSGRPILETFSLDDSPNEAFAKAVRDRLARVRFRPAVKDGANVNQLIEELYRFTSKGIEVEDVTSAKEGAKDDTVLQWKDFAGTWSGRLGEVHVVLRIDSVGSNHIAEIGTETNPRELSIAVRLLPDCCLQLEVDRERFLAAWMHSTWVRPGPLTADLFLSADKRWLRGDIRDAEVVTVANLIFLKSQR